MSKVGTRIFFGLLMIMVLAAVLVLDGWLKTAEAAAVLPPAGLLPPGVLFAAVTALLEILAFVEISRLAQGAGILWISGLGGSLLLAVKPFWQAALGPLFARRLGAAGGDMLLLSLIVAAVFAEQMIRWKTADAIRRVSLTLLAVTYLGVGGALILWIRMKHGVPALVLLLAAVKCTDIGAYFIGTAVGRHKLIPWLSPGKSWEGLIGGLAAGAAASLLLTWALGIGLSCLSAAAFGIVVGLAGQFGDLCESLLKRAANLKDSGAAVPEFGGVLDIIDSPLLAAPAAAILLAVLT